MNLSSHIVLAQASHGGLLLEHPPERGWPHVDLRGLTDQHLLALFAVLLPPGAARDMDEAEGFAHIEASEPSNPAGPWVMNVPAELIALLAQLDEASTAQAVQRWRKSAAPPPPDVWPADALAGLLAELQPMAQLAQATRTADPLQLFLRISTSP